MKCEIGSPEKLQPHDDCRVYRSFNYRIFRQRIPKHYNLSYYPNLLWFRYYSIDEIGDLKRIKQVVKLTGFVNCVDGFSAQPKVVNGCSDLFANVLGERGRHSRSAVGTNALPLNVPVEIEVSIGEE